MKKMTFEADLLKDSIRLHEDALEIIKKQDEKIALYEVLVENQRKLIINYEALLGEEKI